MNLNLDQKSALNDSFHASKLNDLPKPPIALQTTNRSKSFRSKIVTGSVLSTITLLSIIVLNQLSKTNLQGNKFKNESFKPQSNGVFYAFATVLCSLSFGIVPWILLFHERKIISESSVNVKAVLRNAETTILAFDNINTRIQTAINSIGDARTTIQNVGIDSNSFSIPRNARKEIIITDDNSRIANNEFLRFAGYIRGSNRLLVESVKNLKHNLKILRSGSQYTHDRIDLANQTVVLAAAKVISETTKAHREITHDMPTKITTILDTAVATNAVSAYLDTIMEAAVTALEANGSNEKDHVAFSIRGRIAGRSHAEVSEARNRAATVMAEDVIARSVRGDEPIEFTNALARMDLADAAEANSHI